MRSVSVIGIGETKMGRLADRSLQDLIREAGEAAMADAGVSKDQIEAMYIGNFNAQQLTGQGHLGPMAAETLGLKVPAIRMEGACASGGLAFREALVAVAAGIYDIVLVGGVEKMTHRSTEDVTEAIASASDFAAEAEAGVTFPGIFALIANRYFHEYGNAREAMTAVAIQNHANACLNPDAQMPKPVTAEKVETGLKIADPFTIFDCSLVTDGAAFVVICSTETAKKIAKGRGVEVIGSGHGGDTLSIGSKDSLTEFAVTKKAAAKAYDMAGITPGDVDLAEVHDCFTITQIINCEDLGFFPKGEAPAAILAGKTARDSGVVAVNPSGGLKAKGHPIGATGLSQIFEVVTQLRGEAGERQVPGAKIGLTHNLGGTAATCVVHIFKGV
ncbi:MAG: thiolase domain-containing protein [Oscillospiraceae bacterium]|nr:thiolase domain-containing protein [Oscillospiraceae bacterium]